jgi:toxin ParE1/3/4
LALEDLVEIGDYIAKDNIKTAVTFVEHLQNRCYSLGKHPNLGRKREEIRIGMRSITEGNYLILYRLHATYVEIVRVVHTKRDINKLFDLPKPLS